MFLRTCLILCMLLPAVLCEVPIKTLSTKLKGKTGTQYSMLGMCVHEGTTAADPETVTFSVQLDIPTTGFKSKMVKVVSTVGNNYSVTNTKKIKSKFVVKFAVNYDTADGCVPTGTCTMLEAVTPAP